MMDSTPQPPFTTENYTSSDLREGAGPATTIAGIGSAGVLSAGISGVVKVTSGEIPEESRRTPSGYGYETFNSTTISSQHREYQTPKSIRDILYNGTGYYLDDEGDTGLNDLQTLFLACFATLIFLALTVSASLVIRMIWRNYQRTKENTKYDGILHREETSESISRPLHSHLLDADKNPTETHLILTTEEVEICDDVDINNQLRSNNHSNTNGSIITMTMKNNHLIVETEERNDLQEDSRETTLKYCPGARNGVFVVEVQQGVRRSPSSGGHTSCTEPMSISISDQCALVHNPPDRYSDEESIGECDDSGYYVDTVSPCGEPPDSLLSRIKTGLAQSNTSLSRPSYCYSNQQCYDMGSYGYSYGYTERNRLHSNPARMSDDTRPKITAAIYKNTLKRSPSTEDLHLAAMSYSENDTTSLKDICEEHRDIGYCMKDQGSALDTKGDLQGTTRNVDEDAETDEKKAEMGSPTIVTTKVKEPTDSI